ncbi:hypothetical protein ACROYT_G038098 [Oculina patagonica]
MINWKQESIKLSSLTLKLIDVEASSLLLVVETGGFADFEIFNGQPNQFFQTNGKFQTSVQTVKKGSALQLKPRLSLKDVYDALLKSSREQQDDNGSDVKSVKSEPAQMMSSTVSSEQKRVGRKPITFSLQGLQKANSNLQSKLQAIEKAQQRGLAVDDENHNTTTRPHSGPPPSHFDLNDEERGLGPTLKLPPTHLPPITKGVSFKPQARSFNKDEAYKTRVKGREYSLDDIRHCRYLRKRGRTRSEPIETAKKFPHHHHRSGSSSKP